MPSAESPPATAGSRFRCYTLGALFLAAFVAYLLTTFLANPTQRLQSYATYRHPFSSPPWTLAQSLNNLLGNLFSFFFLWLRRGPALLFMPSIAWALLSLVLGNVITLLYVSYLLFVSVSVTQGLTPGSSRAEHEAPVFLPTANKLLSLGMLLLSAALCVVFLAALGRAVWLQGLAGRRDLQQAVVVHGVVVGDLFDLVVPVVFLAVRESDNVAAALGWVIAVLVLDYGAVWAYMVIVAWQSLRRDVAYRYMLFSKSGSA